MPQPLYVIPDIHGHKAKLEGALALIKAEAGQDARIVFLGDLVDRGPDSCGVIQAVIDGQAAGRDWTVLRGNHDQMFLDYLSLTGSPVTPELEVWFTHRGGAETLASYGIDVADGLPDFTTQPNPVPQAHLEFLAAMPLWHETDDLIIAHAGLRPGVPLEEQTPDDLMNIREPFHSDPRDFGKLVVHGHAAIEFPCHHGNRINLDGGAGWNRALHVAVFEGRECWLLDETGRKPLQTQAS